MTEIEKKKILLVEEKKSTAGRLIKTLEKHDYKVIWTDSGDHALSQVKGELFPALVILNYSFGGEEKGLELAQQLQSIKKLPLIFLVLEPGAIREITKNGIEYFGCIEKGWRETSLLSLIRNTLLLFEEKERDEARKQVLKSLAWMLSDKKMEFFSAKGSEGKYTPPYGDLLELNTSRLILDSVGEQTLRDITGEFLDLLDTSAAVYEKNGDYALGIFSSSWCRLMDLASRNLCGTKDNRKALLSGKWLCHESCWKKASLAAIQTGKSKDIECEGGIHLYAVPIRAGEEIIGAIDLGYGDPPQDLESLRKLAKKFKVPIKELKEQAEKYESRPPFLIEIAKQHIEVAARVIGEIVERRLIQEKLHTSEENLSITLNSINDAVIATDDKGRIVRMNPMAETLTGWTEKEGIGKPVTNVFRIVNPETGKPAGNPVKTVLKEGVVVGLANSTLLISKTGAEYQIADSCAPIKDKSDNPVGVVLVFRDVTEDYQIRKKIRDNEKYLNAVLNSIKHGISVLDKDFNIVMVNKTMKKWYAHNLPLEGKKCYQVYQGLPDLCEGCPTKETIETGKPEMKEVPLTSKGSVRGTLELFAFPLLNDQGEVTGVIEYVHDISERKQHERELLASKSLLETAGRIAHLGGWSLSLKEKKIIWSDQVAAIHEMPSGYSPSYEQRISFFAPEQRERVTDVFDKCITKGEAFDEEVEIVTARGKRIWVRITGEALRNETGKITGIQGAYQDINERTLKEKAYHESEERFRLLFETISEGCQVIGHNWRYLYLNEKAAEHGKKKREELTGRLMTEVYPGIEETKMYSLLRECMINRTKQQMDNLFRYPDGSERWFQIRVMPIPEGVFILSLDITEEKKTEESLRKSEERYRLIAENIADTVWIADLSMKIEYISPSIKKYRGFTDKEVMSKPLHKMITPQSMKTMKSILKEELEKEGREGYDPYRKRDFESEEYCKNGSTIITECTAAFLRDDSGKPIGIIGVSKDITERKMAEEKIKNSEERAHKQKAAIAQLIQDEAVAGGEIPKALKRITKTLSATIGVQRTSIWLLSENGEELRCISLYDAEDQTHIEREVLKVENYPDYFESIKIDSRICAEVAQEDMRTRELRDNYLKPLGITSLLDAGIQSEGKLLGIVSMEHIGKPRKWYSDEESFISTIATLVSQVIADNQRKKAEETLIRIQKLESIGKLAGGIAHDYNNMLMIILSYTEMGLSEASPDSALHGYFTEICQAAQRSADITGQLLAFARKQFVKPKNVNLNEEISNVYKMLQNLIVEEIKVVWKQGEDLWQINIDPAQIDQLIANLVINAQEAIQGQGEIVIETSNIVLDSYFLANNPEAQSSEYVLLEVSDTGCGMDESVKKNLFTPFFSTKKSGSNNGLGLATVYGIIKQNRGLINVKSEPGKGSVFSVYFPRADFREITKTVKKTTAKRSGNETILLIDDEVGILEVLKPMLERLGYIVLSTDSPSEAIEMAIDFKGKIDLLITDVVMPEMNGYKLMERITEVHPNMKSLFMTGYTENVIVNSGVLQQGVNFLQKPFLSNTLSEKIRTILDE